MGIDIWDAVDPGGWAIDAPSGVQHLDHGAHVYSGKATDPFGYVGKGSKGGDATEPDFQIPPETPDYAAYMAPFLAAMQQSQSANDAMMKNVADMMAFSLVAPESTKVETIDWAAKNEELQSKINADMQEKANKRRGRASTIYTTSTLEEEAPSLVTSVLEGK